MSIAIIAIVVAVLLVASIVLWRLWDDLSGGDVTFALAPISVGIFILARYHEKPLAVTLAVVLLLLGLYSLYRLYRSLRRRRRTDKP